MATHSKRKRSREERRAQWRTTRAVFLLAGGHPDWIVPFSHNWRMEMADMISLLEQGKARYLTQPKESYYDRISATYPSQAAHRK